MTISPHRQLSLACLILLAVGATGCAGQRLQDERDALFMQNQELQARLMQNEEAMRSADAERANLMAEINNLRSRPTPQAAPPPPPARTTGFEGIAGVETEEFRGQITVRVPGDVLFASGAVELRADAKKTLDDIVGVLTSRYGSNTIRVLGHTDTDPIRRSKWKDNLELSLQRAAAVHRHLVEKGVDPKRMEAVGMGEWSPRASKEQSRRVEIVVVR